MTAIERLQAAPPDVRAAALEMLDEISEPLTARQLDRAFQNVGFSRAQARRFTLALKLLSVIAVVPKT